MNDIHLLGLFHFPQKHPKDLLRLFSPQPILSSSVDRALLHGCVKPYTQYVQNRSVFLNTSHLLPRPAILSQSSTQFTLKSDLDLFLPYPVLLLFSKFSCIYFLPPASHCHQLVSILLSSARLLNSHLLSSLTPSFKLVSKFKRPG